MKIKTKTIGIASIAASLLFTTSFAFADTIGATAGASYWASKKSGQIQSGGSSVNLDNDLNFSNQNLPVLFVSLEHPLPLVPNIRLQFLNMQQTKVGKVNTTFKSINFQNHPVTTNMDMSQFDLTMYYEMLDNWVSLDLGLNIKYFQGDIEITDNTNATNHTRTRLKMAVPMLYASAAADLPFTGLSVIGEVSGVGYSSNRLYDANIKLREQLAVVAFEIGYRKEKIKLNNVHDINVDVDISGPFLSAMIKI
jgi:outer membrane protein